ncbi:MAG: sigma-70 region 4 domain-containing protein, partial [Isosphaeraceae bacterium]
RRARAARQVEARDDYPDQRPGLADPDDLASELERSLARLRPEYRLVFTLYHEQALPYDEIARVVGRPVGTVKTWLHRARAELADDLDRRGLGI